MIKEIAASVGFDVDDESKFDLDKFKDYFQKTYTPTDAILKDETIRKRVVGKVLGSLATKAAQEFELRSSEVDGKPLEEIFSLVKTKYSGIIAAITDKAGPGNDKKLEELELLLKTKDEGIKALEDKYSADSKTWEGNLKSYKLNDKLSKVCSAISEKLTDDYHKNELVKTGFDAHISNNYLFELDNKDELLVKDRKTGDIIKSKTRLGHIATVEEVLLSEAEAKGVLKKNNAKSVNNRQLTVGKRNRSLNNEQETEVKVHPNAIKRTVKVS